jgi:rubrerythrin
LEELNRSRREKKNQKIQDCDSSIVDTSTVMDSDVKIIIGDDVENVKKKSKKNVVKRTIVDTSSDDDAFIEPDGNNVNQADPTKNKVTDYFNEDISPTSSDTTDMESRKSPSNNSNNPSAQSVNEKDSGKKALSSTQHEICGWICSVCTFANADNNSFRCEVCQ